MSYTWKGAGTEWLQEKVAYTVFPEYEPGSVTYRGRTYPLIHTDQGVRACFYGTFKQIAAILAKNDFKKPQIIVVSKDSEGRQRVREQNVSKQLEDSKK